MPEGKYEYDWAIKAPVQYIERLDGMADVDDLSVGAIFRMTPFAVPTK
jgi:hypothetical protein